MSAPRIRVDFNRRSDGYVLASARRATESLHVDDIVIAYQPGEGMERFARVIEVSTDSPRVVLEVDWYSDASSWVPAARGAAAVDALVPTIFESFYKTSTVATTPAQASRARDVVRTADSARAA